MNVIRRPFCVDTVIVDGNALAFRSLFSHEMLSIELNEKLVYTGMAYGFLKMLMAVKRSVKPKKFIVSWDGGSKSKKEIYPEYKAGRHIQKDGINFNDIITSMEYCRKILRYLGIEQVQTKGEESDDIISTIVKTNRNKNYMILTNDHDFFQLLYLKNIRILRMTFKETEFWNKEKFIAKHGFKPQYYPHYLALVGDKTDNIPGIKGIGGKTASTILAQLAIPNLDNLYANVRMIKVTDKVREKLINGKDDAYKFLSIIELKSNAEINSHKEDKNERKLLFILNQLKFNSFLRNSKDLDLLNSL